jgi:solute carrier family 25 phosphate transporter 23/24/25/41
MSSSSSSTQPQPSKEDLEAINSAEPHPYYDEKSVEKERRIKSLFNSLDPDQKGIVTTKDLSEACKLPPHTPFKSDILKAQDASINYDKFKQHVLTKEQELWNIFSAINQKGDHRLKPSELEAALIESGLHVTNSDIEALVQLIDTGKKEIGERLLFERY